MSENYIVFIEQPIKLDLLKFMLYRIRGKSFHKVMTWEPQYETVFHLVNRHTGKVGSKQQAAPHRKLENTCTRGLLLGMSWLISSCIMRF